MKRTFILTLCMCALSAVYAQRHDTVVILTKTEAPVERAQQAAVAGNGGCCDQDFAQKTYANDPKAGYYHTNWELAVKGGINYMNVAPSRESLPTSDCIGWNVGVALDYNFNDVWAIEGVLNAVSITRTGLVGYVMDVDLGVRANITNLIAPHRSELSRRFNVYASTGMGFSPIINKDNEDKVAGFYGVGYVALEAEARFNKLVGLFANAELRAYFTSPNQQVLEPNPYRPLVGANIGLRFHF